MIEVWHMKHHLDRDARFSVSFGSESEQQRVENVRNLWEKGGYVKVAVVDTDNFELAYKLTNNIDTSWSMQPDPLVTVVAPLHVMNGKTIGRKSSEMGDVFVRHNDGVAEYCMVAMFGFERIGTTPVGTVWLWMSESEAEACNALTNRPAFGPALAIGFDR